MTTPPARPLLTERAALILLLAVVVGGVVAVLLVLAGTHPAQAAVAGLAAAGGTIPVAHALIADTPPPAPVRARRRR